MSVFNCNQGDVNFSGNFPKVKDTFENIIEQIREDFTFNDDYLKQCSSIY